MKKFFMVAITLIATSLAYSQNYDIKKVYFQGRILKLRGSVTVSDTLISMIQDGKKADIIVYKIAPNQYKGKMSEDNEIRFTLVNYKDSILLTMDTVDKFLGKNDSCTYWLTIIE